MPTSFDFDRAIPRTAADSIKWGRYAGRDIIPMWVADMDFAAPPEVLRALQERIAQGVLGYAHETPALVEATLGYLQRHFDWRVDPDWLVWLPGLVPAMNVACAATAGGVFTMTPVYGPMVAAGANARREVSTLSFKPSPDGWHWDFDAVDRALAASRSTLWLLCHPHNPLGRDWREDELQEIARLADKHGVTVCSNEIHAGLVLDGRRHRPYASMGEAAAARSITLMAPSKTFNVAGLGAAFAVIPDPGLRAAFTRAAQGLVPHINVLGLVAMEAAFNHGDAWHAALIAHLRGNAAQVQAVLNAQPGLAMHAVEATHLAWLDARALCRERGVDDVHAWFEAGGVGLSPGRDFADPAYAQFLRLNFACPRPLLKEALARMVTLLNRPA